MGKWVASACLALVIAGGVGMTGLIEDRFIYFPERGAIGSPAEAGLPGQRTTVKTPDGITLKGWWLPAGGDIVLLYFHGNAGHVAHRAERARLFTESLRLNVLLVDYRGYGESGGSPSERGLYGDGEAVYSAAVERGFPPERIVLFGESLGSAVAVETALRRPCLAVVLETPFLSIPAMARRHYPFVPSFLVRTRFDNARKIGRLSVPKLILVAERDEIVPRDHAQRLFALAAPPKELVVIPGATHNDMDRAGGPLYLEAWRRFLGGLTSSGTAPPGADADPTATPRTSRGGLRP